MLLLGVSNIITSGPATFYILQEDGFKILAENGDYLIQEDGTPSTIYATWDSANTNANITLTNGDLTATASAADVYAARSTIGKSSGKWYWEITVDATITNSASYGVKTSAEGTTVLVGDTANGYGYTDTGEKKTNGVDTAYGTAPANGVVIGVALNMDDGELTFYRNNVSQGLAFTGLSGTFYAGFSSGFGANAVTANFGASALTYTPPVGFNSGLYN